VLNKTPFREFLHLFWLTGVVITFVSFQDGSLYSHSFKRSRRALSIDVAEHKSILKKFKNTC